MKTDQADNQEINRAKVDELLQENARMRGDLLTIAQRISHDLRTPLGGINVTSEMLKEMLADGSSIPGGALNPIFDSTEDITKLIERVSFILKASVRPISWERVKMGNVIFEVLQKLERRILQSHSIISQPNSWPEVNGVPSWLSVVWWNLVVNALQHAKHAPKIDLGWREENGEFRFWVSDRAGGVPVEMRSKLFQPFESLHEPDAIRGLGLAIVQRLVSLQNGGCGYGPLAEGGSVFYFTLPIKTVGGDRSKKQSFGKKDAISF